MTVEETKRLILQRLEQLRVEPRAPVGVERPPGARRRWFGRTSDGGGIECRLRQLEDRIVALERCFVESKRAQRAAPRAPLPRSEAPAARPDLGGRPYLLNGSVEDGLMTDVLQLIASNQKTGTFSLFMPNNERFDLFVREGEIIHAKAGELDGEAAFFSAMSMGHEQGTYGFLEADFGEVESTISANTQFLILEALRRIDEERKSEGES